jgi:hypothetical protein
MVWVPQVRRVAGGGDVGEVYVVGHSLVDEFLLFAAPLSRGSRRADAVQQVEVTAGSRGTRPVARAQRVRPQRFEFESPETLIGGSCTS